MKINVCHFQSCQRRQSTEPRLVDKIHGSSHEVLCIHFVWSQQLEESLLSLADTARASPTMPFKMSQCMLITARRCSIPLLRGCPHKRSKRICRPGWLQAGGRM